MDLPEIRNHTLKDLIGQGRSGPVYKGIQDSLQREVAIKVISPKLLAHSVVVDEFLEKSRTAASLSHPNLVSIYNVDQDSDELIYYTMEYMTGGSLEDRIRTEGMFTPAEAAKQTLNVSKALEFGRKKEELHGNLKPSKVLFMDDGETFKLSGMGLLLGVVAKHTARNPVPFTAPEVIQTERPGDHRADIFALGGLFYAMLAGQEFFSREQDLWNVTSSGLKVVRPSEVIDDLPSEVDDIILKMMSFEPEERYQEYADLSAPLEELIEKALEMEGDKKEKPAPKKAGPKAPTTKPVAAAGSALEPAEDKEEGGEEAKGDAAPKRKKKKKKKKKAPAAESKTDPVADKEPKAPPPRRKTAPQRVPPGPRRAEEAKDGKLPIGSIIMAVWSIILLGIVVKIALNHRKNQPEEVDNGGEAPTTVEAGAEGSTTVPRVTTVRPARRQDVDKIEPLANPTERVNELIELAFEEGGTGRAVTYQFVPQTARLFQLAHEECDKNFQQGRYLDCLAVYASLHTNHAETPKQKEAALSYLRYTVGQLDKKFNAECLNAQGKAAAGQLAVAKATYRRIGERFGADRWIAKARKRAEQVDQAATAREDLEALGAKLEAATAFRKQVARAESRKRFLLKNLDFAKIADAYARILPAAPTAEVRKMLDTARQENAFQARMLKSGSDLLERDAKKLNIPLVYGGRTGTIVGAGDSGFKIKMDDIEAAVRFSAVEPKTLYGVFSRLDLDTDSLLGLTSFCYANKMVAEAGQTTGKALEEASVQDRRKVNAFVEDRRGIDAAGGVLPAIDDYLAEIEAEHLYQGGIVELAAGKRHVAEDRLNTLVKKHPDSRFAEEAKDLLDGIEEEGAAPPKPTVVMGHEGGGGGVDVAPGPRSGTPSGQGTEKADALFKKAKALYAKAMPGMPDWKRYNTEALKYISDAINLYIAVSERSPRKDRALSDRITEAQRLKFNLMKTRPR